MNTVSFLLASFVLSITGLFAFIWSLRKRLFDPSAAGRAESTGHINPKYGAEQGKMIYTHIADNYAPFSTKMVNVGVRDSTYVLDGLLYHESDLRIEEHYSMRSINRVPCAIGAGVIGTAKVRWRTAAQRPGSLRRQGSSAS